MEAARTPEDRVRERAYSLWEAEGCPDGCADRHWQQAQTELSQAAGGDTMTEAPNAGTVELQSVQNVGDAGAVAGRPRRRA